MAAPDPLVQSTAGPPSSRGLGRRPLTAETGVRIPVAVLPTGPAARPPLQAALVGEDHRLDPVAYAELENLRPRSHSAKLGRAVPQTAAA